MNDDSMMNKEKHDDLENNNRDYNDGHDGHDDHDEGRDEFPEGENGGNANGAQTTISSTATRARPTLPSRRSSLQRSSSLRNVLLATTGNMRGSQLVRRQDLTSNTEVRGHDQDGPRVVEQYVQVVTKHTEAMSPATRWKSNTLRRFGLSWNNSGTAATTTTNNYDNNSGAIPVRPQQSQRQLILEDDGDDDDDEGDDSKSFDEKGAKIMPKPGEDESPQLRLNSKKHDNRWWSFFLGKGTDDEDLFNNNFSFAALIVQYLNWTFRTTFTMLFLQFSIFFWIITLLFAAIIQVVAAQQPHCMQVGSNTFDNTFADAYALSWTTFSTVGYGLVYPSVAVTTGGQCAGINLLTAFESFMGVLYGAICGAIMFGKISRVSSFANVLFSEPILIRYGTGLQENHVAGRIGFPILEFRIVNRMHNKQGGEILNASVTCVAAIEESQASQSIRIAAKGGRRRRRHVFREPVRRHESLNSDDESARSRRSSAIGALLHPMASGGGRGDHSNRLRGFGVSSAALFSRHGQGHSDSSLNSGPHHAPELGRSQSLDARATPAGGAPRPFANRMDKQTARAVVEVVESGQKAALVDEGSPWVPRRIFSPIFVETPSHPFFRRAWIVRHTLDTTSPLLTSKVKRKIAANHGKWPSECNSYKFIRENVKFKQILVSFSGTSNSTGKSIYNQKVYEPEDVTVGYSFSRILHKDPDTGALHVREEFINDVNEQLGGGGEPLQQEPEGEQDNLLAQAFDAARFLHTNLRQRRSTANANKEDSEDSEVDSMQENDKMV